MSPKSAFTYRDYEALPNDGRRYEIHDGDLCVTAAPSFEHQIILSNLVRALMRHVPDVVPGLLLFAPLDVILSDRRDETTIVQPDIIYIAPDRMIVTSARGLEAAPSLAVEILSPSTRTVDRVVKRRLYARYRTPYLWLVDPDARVVEAFALEGDRYVLAASAAGSEPVDLPPFDGLGLVPEALWPAPPRDR
jgi:Uma2 family endonuclease